MNTVIYGPPGTGKTTIAKLLGHMFSKLKVIRIPDGYEYEYDEDDPNVEEIFEVARRDDLIGEYLGHTATKTHAFLEMCLGGVVFIDEVYSLGNKDRNDSFSKEAIDTINLFLSENRDHFMMIIAGYKEEIDSCFFTYNEGLRRRFMWYHTIEPYTPEQLRDIFLLKVLQTDWTYDETVPESVLHVIRQYKDVFPDHAGSIENFITLVKIKHGTRVILLPEHQKKRLTTEDIISAIVSTQKKSKQESFMSMYM
jgi:SpoVK/Ycf46/Vps4 family AAA+-type ATPase